MPAELLWVTPAWVFCMSWCADLECPRGRAGVEAVIDKDMCAALVASKVSAQQPFVPCLSLRSHGTHCAAFSAFRSLMSIVIAARGRRAGHPHRRRRCVVPPPPPETSKPTHPVSLLFLYLLSPLPSPLSSWCAPPKPQINIPAADFGTRWYADSDFPVAAQNVCFGCFARACAT